METIKINKDLLHWVLKYCVEKCDKKPDFFSSLLYILNEDPTKREIEVKKSFINQIYNYCEKYAIYDKLGRYGDFYYKLKRCFWK